MALLVIFHWLQVNHGFDRIEVKDNGAGICKSDTTCMALPHYTSKISNFCDLGNCDEAIEVDDDDDELI